MKNYRIVICFICVATALLYVYWTSNRSASIIPSWELEAVIREQINRPDGDITPEDCLGIKMLNLSASDRNTNLDGLQYFVDLEVLECSAGKLSDISALSELTQLREVTLRFNNISDLTPLSVLTNLERLDITGNNVRDLSPLTSLNNLKHLVIGQNPVERIPNGFAPLENLYGLQIGSYADYSIVVGTDDLKSPYDN